MIKNTAGEYDKKAYLPLEKKQPAEKLFELEVEQNKDMLQFIYDGSEQSETATEDLMETFTSKVSAKLGYTNEISARAVSTKDSISTNFSFTVNRDTKEMFHMHFESYKFGFMDLDIDSAKRLLKEEAKEDINSVDSADSAEHVINKYGIGYIKLLTLGCTFQMWSEVNVGI